MKVGLHCPLQPTRARRSTAKAHVLSRLRSTSHRHKAGAIQTFRFAVGDDFLVFEPQGVVKFDVVNHVTINGGIGYRAVAFTDVLEGRVDGATASLGLEFDW